MMYGKKSRPEPRRRKNSDFPEGGQPELRAITEPTPRFDSQQALNMILNECTARKFLHGSCSRRQQKAQLPRSLTKQDEMSRRPSGRLSFILQTCERFSMKSPPTMLHAGTVTARRKTGLQRED